MLAAGVFDGDGPDTHLLEGPVWFRLPGELPPSAVLRRTLDLRTGLLHESIATPDSAVSSVRFSSLAGAREPSRCARSFTRRPTAIARCPALTSPSGDAAADTGTRRGAGGRVRGRVARWDHRGRVATVDHG